MQIICIDPGHGGDDAGPGPLGTLSEKDYVLALARRLGNACRDHQWQVSLTRIDDRALSTEQRAFRANRMGATCFLSLHTCADLLPTEAPPAGTRLLYQGGRGQGFALAGAVRAAVAGCGLPAGDMVAAPRLDLLRWCSIPAIVLELRAAPSGGHSVLETAQGQQELAQALAAAVAGVFSA